MKKILLLLVVGFLFFSCKRKDVDFIGPGYISAPEGFAVTSFTASSSSVDFVSGSVDFDASFTHPVTWTLTIKGDQSGAVKEIKGTSAQLVDVLWTGSHDGVAFFKNGETATATLSFIGSTLTATTNVTITGVKSYTGCGQYPQYGDFEDASKIIHGFGWHAFNDPTPIPNVTQGVGTSEVDYKGNVVNAIQGNNYYFIKGLGNQQYFVSGIQYDIGVFMTPIMSSDPENVWVNMFIYGTGDANTQVEIEYQEADQGDTGTPNTYNGAHDDAFVAKITLDHVGWKLFSFQYKKLVPSLNASFGGSGNKVHEPHRLRSFGVVLIKKSNANSPVEIYFDYPIITQGGPFKPCN